MPSINEARLMQDLRELRTFGGSSSHPLGVVRPSFSEPDMASRWWLQKKFEDAGLAATIDGVGNVIGRSRNPGPALLLGSHSDTQPRGGWLDGAMGVIYALEAVRALSEDPSTAHLAVDIASWMDEEGTYLGMVGCKSFCGLLDEEALNAASSAGVTAEDGETLVPPGHALADAIAAAGLTDVPRVKMDPDRYCGYFEAHIEQGPWLEQTSNRIGVVSGCVGIDGVAIDFIGQQNHAGTTPMHLRADAAMVAIKLAARIDDHFKAICSDSSVWTFGNLDISPGAASIVPGHAKLVLQYRDPSVQQQKAFQSTARRLIEECAADVRNHRVQVEARWRGGGGGFQGLLPALMDAALLKHVEAAAEKYASGEWMTMPSGAGHDAQTIAQVMPSAMLFVPSIEGKSHVFDENTSDDDLILGCRVFTDACALMLEEATEPTSLTVAETKSSL